MYDNLKGQGFTIVAVNGFEPAATLKKAVSGYHITFPVLMNGKKSQDVAKRYGVEAYPTNYVIDRKGKIIARFVGFDENGIKSALRKAGIRGAR